MNKQSKQNNGRDNNYHRPMYSRGIPFLAWTTVVLLVSILLAACGRGREEATPTATPTPLYSIESENVESEATTPSDDEQPESETQVEAQVETQVETQDELQLADEQAEPDAGLIAQVDTDQLQFRVAPGADSAVIRLLDQGEQFIVLGRDVEGTWIKLARQGEVPGWVSAEFVTLSGASASEMEALTQPPAEPTEDATALDASEDEENLEAREVLLDNTVVTINADYLNVRREPLADSEISLLAQRGQQFDVIAANEDSTWLQITTGDEPLGWVAREFVTLEEKELETADSSESITQTTESAVTESVVTGSAVTEDVATEVVTEEVEEEVAESTSDSETTTETTTETATEMAEITVVETEPTPETKPNTAILDGPVVMENPDFGAQAFLWWRSEIADRDLNLMTEAGFGWVKQTFAWEDIEGNGKGKYNWLIADRVVQQINSRGLKLLARVSSDPLADFWAGHPPANANDYAEFVFELANRYNCTAESIGCIHAFQIWNEPNLAREWGDKPPNPVEYVAFLGKAYNAIKIANPNAVVINAGMAPTGDYSDIAMPDDVFYKQMYEAMGGDSSGFFDKLGVHGAGFAAPPELDPAEAAAPDSPYGGYRFFSFRHVEDIREIMVQNGDEDKQIVLLEFGWTYDSVNPSYKWHGSDAGIDAALQGKYLLRAYEFAAENWQPWIGLMSLLTMPNLDWLDDGNPEDEEQYWWAILEPAPIDQLYLRPAYVELCIYFNNIKGQRCIYDPN